MNTKHDSYSMEIYQAKKINLLSDFTHEMLTAEEMFTVMQDYENITIVIRVSKEREMNMAKVKITI